jgi:transcriptional regulator with XRE-family HTH domain
MAELDRFSPTARTALQFARAAAERMNHPSIGTEHLLLGVVEEREDLAGYLLSLLGVGLKDVTRAITRITGGPESAPSRRSRLKDATGANVGSSETGDEPMLQKLQLTEHARIALETAERERQRLGHDEIQTVHMLLGILGMPTSVAAAVFRRLAIDVDELRSSLYVMYQSDGNRPPIGPVLERIRDARDDDLERTRTHVKLSEDDVGGRVHTVLGFARNAAITFGHESIGTDHLLLGFVADRDCDAARVLSGLGLTEKRLTLAIRFARGLSNSHRIGIARPIPLSPRAWNAIELALLAARHRHAPERVTSPIRYKWWPQEPCPVDSTDLLLGVLEAGNGLAVTILTSFGLDLAEVRQRAVTLRDSAVGPIPRVGPVPGTFWEWINQQLIRRQWSLADLARETGIERRRLRAWVRCKGRPSVDSCDALAAACTTDPNLVRRLAGRPPKPAPIAPMPFEGESPGDQLTPIEAMRVLFDQVRWDEGRIARMTELLRTMVRNDQDAEQQRREFS